MQSTANSLIHIGNPIEFDSDEFLHNLQPLLEAAYMNDANIREDVQKMVSTYHPAGEHGSNIPIPEKVL